MLKFFLFLIPLSCSIWAAEPVVTEIVKGMKFVESPVWDSQKNILYFSDTQDDKFYQWTESEGAKVVRTPAGKPNGNRLAKDGKIYTCEHWGRRVAVSENGTAKTLVDSYEGKKLNSPNDCTLKSDGTLWFTDPIWGLEGRAKEQEGSFVYSVDLKSNMIKAMIKTRKGPNGIAFSPDEKWLYIGDSGKVYKYPVSADNSLGEPELFINRISADGFRTDSKGNLYIAIRGPVKEIGIRIYDPAGKLLHKIPLSEPTTNLCVVEDKVLTLYASTLTKVFKIELK